MSSSGWSDLEANPGSDVYEYHEPAECERLRFRSRRSTLWLRADELVLLSRRRRGREMGSGATDVAAKAGETGESMTNAGGVAVNGNMVFNGPGTGELRSSGDAEMADGEGEVDASRSCTLADGVRRVAGLFGLGVCCVLNFLTGGGEGGLAATLARKAALTALETVVSSAKLDFRETTRCLLWVQASEWSVASVTTHSLGSSSVPWAPLKPAMHFAPLYLPLQYHVTRLWEVMLCLMR